MAKSNHSRLTIFGLKRQRSYTVQGAIFFLDDQGAEHQFGVLVVGDSKPAAERYLTYVGSDQYPHVDWLVQQTALADGTGGWLPLPDAEFSALSPGDNIMSAFIQPVEIIDREITVSEEISYGKTETILVVSSVLSSYSIKLTVEAGVIEVSVRRPDEVVTSARTARAYGVGIWWLNGPYSGVMLVDAKAIRDAAGSKFTLETVAPVATPS